MVRYANTDDIEWIVSLQKENRDVVSCILEGDKLLDEINNKNIIIREDNNKKYSFMHFRAFTDYIHVLLLLTDVEYRNQGYARLLYSYVISKYRLPIRYTVEAGSESENIWAKRNESVLNRHKIVNSGINMYGKIVNDYVAALEEVNE